MKITYKGRHIECTREEIPAVLRAIADEEERAARRDNLPAWQKALQSLVGATVSESPWTRDLFWKFVESLGDSQRRALSLLVRNRKMADEGLRKALKVESNQALAGVLSGLSKTAASLDVPARSVYTVEDEQKSGETHKAYAVSLDFLQMAMEMNWPED